ncbi:carboxypeptidase-like regulatory domain-containing protein [Dysgonomonas reticulitermitis]
MKTKYIKTAHFLIVISLMLATLSVAAQDYITVTGVVKDKRSNKKLEYVNISVHGTSIGTVTNADGGFSIKIKDSIQVKTLEISHIGYFNQQFPVKSDALNNITILLTPNDRTLKEVIVHPTDPLELVEKAIEKIAVNNSHNKNMLTGFYRETVRKRRNYINISEAIINIYKTPYTEGTDRDRVQIYKGRKLLSPKPGDTLIVKFEGGPTLSTYLDVVKNKDVLLDKETLHYYKFKMENPVMIDEHLHYVVSFQPQVVLPYALFYGKLYIDNETLTFSRAEFSLSMDDRNKATQAILKKKPFGMHFKPEDVSYLVTYKTIDGISYLNYVRNEVRFKCDWKRKLFSTGYTIVSEMVVTDKREDNVSSISHKDSFNKNQVLSDKVRSFYDSNFWEDYNIIEPTESLDAAVSKLKKQQ